MICARFAPNVQLARKLFQTQTTELLSNVGHVKSCFGLIGDGVSICASEVQGLRQTYYRLNNRFGRTRRYTEVTRHKWNIILVLFVDSANHDAR
jgi:hypothetical protein